MAKPVVALVGRPNVGKSTLFNRLAGEQLAVVAETPGTTRDRLVTEAEWRGVRFDIVDTGGIDPTGSGKGEPLSLDSADYIPQIRAQAELAAGEADAVLFLVDGEAGLTPADEEVAGILRRVPQPGKGSPSPPILVVVNKCDTMERRAQAVDFYALGMGDPMPISAFHGTGTGDLLDRLVDALGPRGAPAEEPEAAVRIAIIGRPNVGKSSLLNRLLGEERAIVSPIPGTTRDAVDTHLIYHGAPITLIDTAGIRRRGRIERGVEKYSVLRALRALERADVALLMIDATEGVTAQDAHVAGMALDKMKSVVILVNKWDLVSKDSRTFEDYSARVRQGLHFLDYVPVLLISAKSGQRVGQVLPTALRVQEERLRRVPTSEINRVLRRALEQHAPPARGGRPLKVLYVSQVRTDPPTFLIHVNDPKLVHFTYARYLENQIRREYGFLGTPIRLSFRKRARPRRQG
ncbi:MAG: ribosome biogenesis GTPase Der [Chloroflexi bacterium RBG_13_66_10]|nr:MAG: ribosome biogenesis GTPase Der [Chloroflexi bacterium RBG_13_66_10]